MNGFLIAGIIVFVILVLLFLMGTAESKRVNNLDPAERAIHDEKLLLAKEAKEAKSSRKNSQKELANIRASENVTLQKKIKIFDTNNSTIISDAKKELKSAGKEYESNLRRAEKDFSRLEKEMEAKSAEGRRAIREADSHGRNKVIAYSGIDGELILHEHNILIKGKLFPVTNTLRAEVSRTGEFSTSSRTTLTRLAAGGLLFGPVGALAGGMLKKGKTHDLREVYLVIESDAFAAVITCGPNGGMRAQQIAAEINTASKLIDTKISERPNVMAVARRNMRAIDSEIKTILDAALIPVQLARLDRGRLDDAEFELLLIDEKRQGSGQPDISH